MSATQDADTVEYLLVMHDFIARSPDELDLKKGSKVELLERDDEYGDGWYQVSTYRDNRAFSPITCS